MLELIADRLAVEPRADIGRGGDGWGFVRNRNFPLDLRFLVIDEASMIDAGLMADLLDALPDGASVLFVGDTYQLPPVGHGAPLRDLIGSGVVGYGELTEVRRNSGLIVEGCRDIKAGRPVVAWQVRFPRVQWWMCPGRDVAEVTTFRLLERFWKERQKS